MSERSIFIAALEKDDAAERAAYLDEACAGDELLRARIERLLKAHEPADSFLERGPAGLDATDNYEPGTEPTGTVIGPYKLIEPIGEGGMGSVWMAQQTAPIKRLVAVKLIKAGMDSRQVIARFEAERQALALMDHPNIARVLDAGTDSAGRPYFVMDLVKGMPITRYCDLHHLTPRQRLELFIPVCQAVQHAHQKGIIHRDLKPSNVLIALYDGKPVPKIIDFGVAKAAGQQLTDKTLVTGFGAIVGTLEYMSPEQAEVNQLDIDTRSDIYSLGVLLYELLTGSPPFRRKELTQAAMLEMLRVIREQEPSKPSTKLSTVEELPTLAANRGTEPAKLKRLVRGELDWIVMKALEKDRNCRYETANGFAMDVDRYLADEPVQACPPSAGYRLRKFARKNRTLLAAAGTFAALLLIATLAAMFAAAQSARLASQSTRLLETEHELRSTAERRVDEERKAKQKLEWNLYLNRIARAQQEVLAQNIGGAEELLEECPVHLRGWEWHFLKRHGPGNPLAVQRYLAAYPGSAAFSPDGRYLAAAGEAANIEIVDLTTGEKIRTLRGITGFIESWGMAFHQNADETILAACEYNGKVVRLWNIATGQEVRVIEGHGVRLRSVAFSPDGQQLAVGDCERGARIWDWRAGRLMFELTQPRGISRFAYSPNGRQLAIGVWDNERAIIVRDSASGQEIGSFGHHGGIIEGVAYSPKGNRVISSGSDGMVKVWNANTGELHLTLSGHTGRVNDVAVTPDGRRIASAGWDKTIKIWDAETGEETLTLRGHAPDVNKVAFSPNGDLLVSAGHDGVKVWDATPVGEIADSEAFRVPGHAGSVTSVAFSPDGQLLASAGSDRLIKVWEMASLGRGTEPRGLTIQGHGDGDLSLAFSPDSRRLAAGAWGAGIKIWDTATARELLTVGAGIDVTGLAFSPDGRKLASIGAVRLNIWNAHSGESHLSLRTGNGGLQGLAYSLDGKYVAVGNWHELRIWDTATAEPVRSFRHSDLVWSVAYRFDGQRIASASTDLTVKIWDPINGKEIQTLRGHTDRVLSVAFSPGGRIVASGSADSTVKLWDAATGEEITTLRGHSGYVWRVAFSPDGKRLASGGGHSAKGEVKVWDLAANREMRLRDLRAEAANRRGQPDPRDQSEKARRFYEEGNIFERQGSAHKAKEFYANAAALYEKLTSEFPGVSAYRVKLVETLAKTGRFEEAMRIYRDTSAHLEQLEKGPGSGDELRRSFASSCDNLSASLKEARRFKEAEEVHRRAIALWERLVTDSPRIPENRVGFGHSLSHLSQLLIAAGQTSEVENILRKTLAVFEQLVADFPNEHYYQVEAAHTCWALLGPFLEAQSGRRKDAEQIFRRGLAAHEKMIAASPRLDPGIWPRLASNYDSLVNVLKADGRVPDALKVYRRAIDFHARLVTNVPDEPAFRVALADAYAKVADVLREAGQISESEEPARKAIEICEKLAADIPRNSSYQLEVGQIRRRLATARALIHIRLSQWDKAATEYAKIDLLTKPLPEDAYAYACLFLIRGNSDGYDHFCQGMIERAGKPVEHSEAFVLARTFAMAGQSAVDLARVVQWANQALAGDQPAWYLHTLGLAQYRAGQFDQALQSFAKADVEAWIGRGLNWFGLALVHHRLGHPDEARQCLDKGIQWLVREGPPGPGQATKIHPFDWLEAQVLRRETEETLKIKRSP